MPPIDSILGETPSAPPERDIDLVLITGAGASREFGKDGEQMPLMGDWSEAIIRKLYRSNPAYLDVTGLRRNMSGEEFEAQLGRFLRQVEAMPLIEDLLDATAKFHSLQNPAFQAQNVLQDWHRSSVHHRAQIVDLIRQTLYEEFAVTRIDLSRAAESYFRLYETLGIGKNSRWVYATTNYDVIEEIVTESLGYFPDWGVPPRTDQTNQVPVHVSDILDGLPRYVPVLHLHGRLGWYRRIDNANDEPFVYATSNTLHQQEFGVPIVMLPDPNKVYDNDDIIAALWGQLRQELQRAKFVLVLGHSLNDGALIRAIAENVDRVDRICVTFPILDGNPNQPSGSADSIAKKARDNFGIATKMIPMRFGSRHEDTEARCFGALGEWRKHLLEKGLI